MNEAIRNKISSYRREVEDQRVNSSIYSLILVVTVLVYGFFGIIPLYRVLVHKYSTYRELTALNKKLMDKKESIDAVKAKLAEAAFYIEELDKVVSPDTAIEDYMVALVNNAATTGFKQRSLVLQGEADSEINLRVNFQGSETQLTALIESLENMQRLTIIDSFNYSQREDTANVELALHVFYLPN